MQFVKAKKHLGQHFLKNEEIAERIANSLTVNNPGYILEIGPGMGVLTKYFLNTPNFYASEIDTESIEYLKKNYPKISDRILDLDFLKLDLKSKFDNSVSVIGNFPYNISSQILFHIIDHKDQVPEIVGMFQKEVAERICNGPGTKEYGILSVLLQTWYDCSYLFTVGENEFNPPPKVKSGVIRCVRNSVKALPCDEKLYKTVIKTGFNQRRKTLRNSLKSICNGIEPTDSIFTKRPEQLGVQEFIELTNIVMKMQKGGA